MSTGLHAGKIEGVLNALVPPSEEIYIPLHEKSEHLDAESNGDIPYDGMGIETAIDLHSQTDFSDGQQTITQLISEAEQNHVYLKGISDHGNVGTEAKNYDSSFYNHAGLEHFGFTDPDVYVERDHAIDVETDSPPGGEIIRWSDADMHKVAEDLQIIREFGEQYSADELNDFLHYDMVVLHGFEPDYNPMIETAENKKEEREAVREYNQALIEFIDDAFERGVTFDYVNLAVHDVFFDGRHRYVKKPEYFEDLSLAEKEEIWDNYRKKQLYTFSTDELSEGDEAVVPVTDLMEARDIFVIGAHPAIIERNHELMEVFHEDQASQARDEVEQFIHGSVAPDGMDPTENLAEAVTDEEIAQLYPEDALKEYWKPLAETSGISKNHVYEVNGKHVERYPPSVLWEMLDEHTFGSDQHRPGEQPFRSRRFRALELPGEFRTVMDLYLHQQFGSQTNHDTGAEQASTGKGMVKAPGD